MAPLSPSSISSADAAANILSVSPRSPQSEATHGDEDGSLVEPPFTCAMFSPKKYSETHDDSNEEEEDKVDVTNDIKIDVEEEVEDDDDIYDDAPHDEETEAVSPVEEAPTDEVKDEEEKEAAEDEQKPTSPTTSTIDKANNNKEKTVSTPPSTTKSKKSVTFVEKNPPPLSPMSYQSSVKMLSPASSRDETITSDATSFDEGLNSPDQAISNNNNTTSNTKSSSTALVDIPDDESEASLMVLMRYMGCTPIPYGSGPQRKPRSTSDVDDHSLLSDQYTYDNDLQSKDTFDTIEPHEIDGIKKSWTLDNDEVGVELDLDTLMINDVKDRLKKHNNNNLSVNTNDNIEDVPSDEQKGGSVTSPEGTTTTTTEEEEGSRDVKFGAMLSVDEKLEKEKNGGVGLTSFNNYLEKKGSASLQSESLASPTIAATNPGSPVVKFVTSPGGGVLSDDALHSFLADKEASVAGVPTSTVESTTSGLQRLPGGKLSIVTSPTGGPNEAAAVTSPVVKFVTSPGGGVLSDDALHSYLASNVAAATPAAVTTVTLPSPTSGEVSKAMAKVAAYKKAMAEVKAASAAAESEKNSKKKLSSEIATSSQPSDTSFPVDVDVVQDVDDKVEETASIRSDKENQTDTVEVSSDSKTDTSSTKVTALAVETSAQDDTAVASTSILSPAKSSVLSPTAKKSVQEVDELLSKTRDWLVRHNESQKKKVPSSLSEEQKVTGKTVLSAIENSETPPPSSNKKDEQKPNNVTGKSVINAIDLLSPKGTNTNISKESPKTLDEMLQSKKNGTSSNTALLAMLSPKSASERTTTTPPTTDDNGPKKSIMEQLEEIRIKQRELESRQPKAKQEEQIETS